MSAVPQEDGGDLPGALTLLEDAIHTLCGPQSVMVDDKLMYVPSRYLQLQDAIEGEQVNTGGGGGSKSRPPFWCDAFDLLHEIDQAVECWQPAFDGVPPTVGRLKWIAARSWRPEDVGQIGQITRAVAEWAHSITTLLDPPRRWSLPSACPACNTTVVYKRDAAGEMVRQPALQISPDGCTCLRCKEHWPPERFLLLAAVLGCDKPEGVLE